MEKTIYYFYADNDFVQYQHSAQYSTQCMITKTIPLPNTQILQKK